MNNPLIKTAEKIEATKKKARKVVKGWKFRLLAIFLGLLGTLLVLDLACRNITAFTNSHKIIRQPILRIKIQWPYRIESLDIKTATKSADGLKNGQILTPTLVVRSEYEIIMATKHGTILWNVYMLESTRGKADYCRNNNLGYGGFGVMSAGEIVCYESFEKAVERAEYWLVKAGVDKDLDSALCYFNLGVKQPMCNYSITYHTL